MLTALQHIRSYKSGNLEILKTEPWLKYLVITKEKNINLERVHKVEIDGNPVLDYVERTLELLEKAEISLMLKLFVEETLKWSEVAKCGSPSQRKKWQEQGIDLFVHNEGSAEIYKQHILSKGEPWSLITHEMIYRLIMTHGLLGQLLRGEVGMRENAPLLYLLEQKIIDKDSFTQILWALNECVIGAVSEDLWDSVRDRLFGIIQTLKENKQTDENTYTLMKRMKKLRSISAKNGENTQQAIDTLQNTPRFFEIFQTIFEKASLWYVEPALHDFSFDEFAKIFAFIFTQIKNNELVHHVSFEDFMKEIYYDYKGSKKVNIYKKRVIEKYLASHSIENILNSEFHDNLHVSMVVETKEHLNGTAFFNFRFSPAGHKLIEFCMEAEKTGGTLYEKAIILLFDLFQLRRDAYDRFHNEEKYLNDMNSSGDDKKILLDYVVGDTVLDIGPGGGIMLDMLEEQFPNKKAIGIDISHNVIDVLEKRKERESKNWEVIHGDALNLKETFQKGEIDTIVFSSILHELYSYIPMNGQKFNYDTIKQALESAYDILPVGGRILIRDGIMTEPAEQKRIIRFISADGLTWLKRYANDFQGREIKYEIVGKNEVLMNVNDCMEFLYTYTWGEESYNHEVQEQFGYFTPREYQTFIKETLGEHAAIIECKHYLQEGYTIHLSQKVEFFDGNHQKVDFPDSTSIIVIEKKG